MMLLLMVEKALDMSMPILLNFHLFFSTTEANIRWQKTISAHNEPFIYSRCHSSVYSFTFRSNLY